MSRGLLYIVGRFEPPLDARMCEKLNTGARNTCGWGVRH